MKRRKGARNPSGKEISVTETFQFQERGVNTNAAKKLNKIRIKRMNKVYHVLPTDFDGCWEPPPPTALETVSAHSLCRYIFTCYLPTLFPRSYQLITILDFLLPFSQRITREELVKRTICEYREKLYFKYINY